MKELLQPMIQNQVVSPSISDITSPVLLIKKKSGEYRFCVDYRRFNQRLIQDVREIALHSSL